MRDVHVIAFGGYAGAGKDTIAAALVPYLVNDYSVHVAAFADPIRDCAASLGISRHLLEDPARKNMPWKYGKTPRDVMILIGSVMRKEIGPVWIDMMSEVIRRCQVSYGSQPCIVLVTDLRFEEEAQMLINRHDTIIVDVTRPGVTRRSSDLSEAKGYLPLLRADRDLKIINEHEKESAEFFQNTISTLLNHIKKWSPPA